MLLVCHCIVYQSSAMLTLHKTNCCFYRSIYKLFFTSIKVTQEPCVTIKLEVCLVILVHIQDDLCLVCVMCWSYIKVVFTLWLGFLSLVSLSAIWNNSWTGSHQPHFDWLVLSILTDCDLWCFLSSGGSSRVSVRTPCLPVCGAFSRLADAGEAVEGLSETVWHRPLPLPMRPLTLDWQHCPHIWFS